MNMSWWPSDNTGSRWRRRIAGVLGGILAIWLTTPGCAPTQAERQEAMPYHHTADGFRNPEGSPVRTASTVEFLGFLFNQLVLSKAVTVPPGHLLDRGEALAQLTEGAGRDSITWVGHATFLLRLDGVTVLTDPFFMERASPFSWAGPKRFVPPGIPIESLPPVDLIIVSHNHYEHLDLRTIEALPHKARATVIVPLGLGHYFTELGYRDVRELDWLDGTEAAGLKITALPAIHFSKRGLFDRNETLWASYSVQKPDGYRLFFSGDTAYGPVFAMMGESHGPFDFAMIGIGAYEPRSIMVASHATPEEAVRLGRDIGARQMVGMHWGTISLTPEPPFEAAGRFKRAAGNAGYGEEDAWIMKIGETRRLAPQGANEPGPARLESRSDVPAGQPLVMETARQD